MKNKSARWKNRNFSDICEHLTLHLCIYEVVYDAIEFHDFVLQRKHDEAAAQMKNTYAVQRNSISFNTITINDNI